MKKMTFFLVNRILLLKHSWTKKIQPLALEWLESAIPELFWALPKSAFGEHASNNNPNLKQLTKKRKKDCIGDLWQ